MNRDMVKGLAVGLGVGLLAPMVFPALGRVLKPSVNAAIRAGVVAWDRGRETLAELGEYAEDMAAEVRAQHPAETSGLAASPPEPEQEGGRA